MTNNTKNGSKNNEINLYHFYFYGTTLFEGGRGSLGINLWPLFKCHFLGLKSSKREFIGIFFFGQSFLNFFILDYLKHKVSSQNNSFKKNTQFFFQNIHKTNILIFCLNRINFSFKN